MAGFLPRSTTFVGLPEAPLESVSSAGSHVSAAMPLEPLAQARAFHGRWSDTNRPPVVEFSQASVSVMRISGRSAPQTTARSAPSSVVALPSTLQPFCGFVSYSKGVIRESASRNSTTLAAHWASTARSAAGSRATKSVYRSLK